MIRFACTCSFVLEVPTELAGTSMQCPQCGRLVDIPPLGELAGIDEDGTYKMDVEQLRDEPDRLAEQFEVFTQKRIDEYGHEKDLRPTEDDFQALSGPESFELSEKPDPEIAAPKYDPVTGELIRPLEVRPDPPKPAPPPIPVASNVLSYARPENQEFSGWRILPEMFKLTNIIVMLVILIGHVFQQFVLFVAMAGFWLLVPAGFILSMLFFSHYAIIIDDIGREGHDDLPRPLRDLSWHDDLWGPFVHFFGSLVLCYGPIFLIIWMPRLVALAWIGTVLFVGTMLFPAVLLTMTTSGSITNLSPDRLLGVVGALGGHYVVAVALWIASVVVYVGGFSGTMLSLYGLFFPKGALPWYLAPPMWATYPLLLLGVIVMHGFCWYVGLLYRRGHDDFGWAFQRHARETLPPSTRRNRDGLPAQLIGPVASDHAQQSPQSPSQMPPPLPPTLPVHVQPVPQRALPVPPSQQQP